MGRAQASQERWPPRRHRDTLKLGCTEGGILVILQFQSPWVRARTGLSLKQGPVTQHAFLTAGGWLVPGAGTLCPPASSHPQFGGSLSLPSTHCERYPALRNHRSSPYPSPYAHRNNSPSRSCTSIHQLGGSEGGGEDPSGETFL